MVNWKPGGVYVMEDYGQVEFVGVDRYWGETTLKFRGITYPGFYFLFPHVAEEKLETVPSETKGSVGW